MGWAAENGSGSYLLYSSHNKYLAVLLETEVHVSIITSSTYSSYIYIYSIKALLIPYLRPLRKTIQAWSVYMMTW